MNQRTLMLLRHGKSSWKSDAACDFDRPLGRRGLRDGERFGADLGARLPRPELVLCSSARRTRDTLAFLIPSLIDPQRVAIEDGLYLAEAEALLARLRAVPESITRILLIGHNPGLTDLARLLTDDADRALDNLPTFAVAEFTLVMPFGELKAGGARLKHAFGPRGPLL